MADAPRDDSFIAQAVTELRNHRYCGDNYPPGGWYGINRALAQYQLEKRKLKQATKPK